MPPKEDLVRAAASGLVALIRCIPNWPIKNILSNSVFDPYFSWRDLRLRAKTSFGYKMDLDVADLIQSNILLTGLWEPAITQLISETLSEGDVFIDIGANVGYFTLLGSKLVGRSGKVYAFEASPKIFRRLEENVQINALTNVELFNVAISDAAGKIWIWEAAASNIGHATIMADVANIDGHTKEAEVACDVLQAIVPEEALGMAKMIKMDIEGAERLALEGLAPILGKFENRTEWIVELSPSFSPQAAANSKWIFDAFSKEGYKAFEIPNSHWRMREDSFHPRERPLEALFYPPREGLHDVLFSKARRHP